MPDRTLKTKTKQQLIAEVEALQQRVTALEIAAADKLHCHPKYPDQDGPISSATASSCFRQLVETAPVAILLMDTGDQIVQVNQQVEALFGYERTELVGQSIEKLLPERVHVTYKARRVDFFAKPAPGSDLAGRRKNGSEFPIEIGLSHTMADEGTLTLAFVTDLTERKQAEGRERAIAHSLRGVVEATDELITIQDLDTFYRRAVELAREKLGVQRVGIHLFDANREYINGTYGTDVEGHTTDEHGAHIEYSSEYQRMMKRRDDPWIVTETEHIHFDGEQIRRTGHGWVATTMIRIGNQPIGIFSNDTAMTHAPLDPIQQEAIVLYCSLLSHLFTRKRTEAQILALNADLEQRVLDRTAALREANERLQALSQVKDEFVSNVSHELRTPITSLKLRQYLLRAHPDQLESHLRVIERETERLHRTIEDLLQLSRLDQRRTDFVLLPTTINPVLGNYVADRELTARAKGLILNFEADQTLPLVLADKGLLEQTIGILLTNAINYTPSGGLVTVSTLTHIEDGKTWAGFSVADNGPGISQTDQVRLFERFFRGATARTSGVSGTGLGLAIAKEIIDQHNGRIKVESSGIPGEGTRFVVWLPGLDEVPLHQPDLHYAKVD
jgi:protein-histidine pros-kinase